MYEKNKSPEKNIISFPVMGNIHIPVASVLKKMGASVLLPPPNNRQALSLGIKYSHENICLPYKLNLGNYIQALEMGANTLLMFQAPGTCRLGNYTKMAEIKLKELGYDFEMIVFDLYKGKLKEVINKFGKATGNKSFKRAIEGITSGLAKFNALDTIERKLFYIRPREIKEGQAEKIYLEGRSLIDKAENPDEVKIALKESMDKYNQINIDKEKDVLKVCLTGEFYVLLDPFTNMEIEKELGILGVEVDRKIMLSDWMNQTITLKWFKKNETHKEMAKRKAKKYLTRIIGGECVETIGDTVEAAEQKADGIVHLSPFNCIPEIVSQCILPHVSRKENIPIITFLIDEQNGKIGIKTRLEAFVDLMKRHKLNKIKGGS